MIEKIAGSSIFRDYRNEAGTEFGPEWAGSSWAIKDAVDSATPRASGPITISADKLRLELRVSGTDTDLPPADYFFAVRFVNSATGFAEEQQDTLQIQARGI